MNLFQKSMYILSGIAILSSCAGNRHLPTPKKINESYLGADAHILRTNNETYLGELIEVTSDSMHILINREVIKSLDKKNIKRIDISYSRTSNSPGLFALWATFNCLSTIGHGIGLLFTLPLNLIVGITVATDAANATNDVAYPDQIKWEELSKFARYPQGIPEGIDINLCIKK